MRAREGEGKRVRVVVLKGNATGVDGCIVEAHALELDEHLSLHIRVSIFFPLASGSLFLSLTLSRFSLLSRSSLDSTPPCCFTLSTFFVGLLFQKGPGLMQISS